VKRLLQPTAALRVLKRRLPQLSRIPEVSVKIRRFDRPVSIFVGLGFPRDVETVLEAYQVLTEWPAASRGAAHERALVRCRAALADGGDVQGVRTAFETFARERGILAPDALTASAKAAAREWLGA
jgi:hypothetical protein